MSNHASNNAYEEEECERGLLITASIPSLLSRPNHSKPSLEVDSQNTVNDDDGYHNKDEEVVSLIKQKQQPVLKLQQPGDYTKSEDAKGTIRSLSHISIENQNDESFQSEQVSTKSNLNICAGEEEELPSLDKNSQNNRIFVGKDRRAIGDIIMNDDKLELDLEDLVKVNYDVIDLSYPTSAGTIPTPHHADILHEFQNQRNKKGVLRLLRIRLLSSCSTLASCCDHRHCFRYRNCCNKHQQPKNQLSTTVAKIGNFTILSPSIFKHTSSSSSTCCIIGPQPIGPMSVWLILTISTVFIVKQSLSNVGTGTASLCISFYTCGEFNSLVKYTMISFQNLAF